MSQARHGSRYRILSLDGGGIRGYYTARLLARLETEQPGWISKFDLVAGTSTGAIIALGLADGLTPTQIADIYATDAPRVFEVSLRERLRDGGGLYGPRYRLRRLAALLRGVFRDRHLSDLSRAVAIPAFDLTGRDFANGQRRWEVKVFHNLCSDPEFGSLLLRKVALYSSAVPAVFATIDGYIDGGVYAANPSLMATAQALLACRANGTALSLDSLRVFSVGTGLSPLRIDGDRHEWGLVQWAKPLLGLTLDANMSATTFQAEQLLGSAYYRLNPWIDGEPIMLDDAGAIPRLEDAAQASDLSAAVEWLKTQW